MAAVAGGAQGKVSRRLRRQVLGLVPERKSEPTLKSDPDVSRSSALTPGPSPETGEGSRAKTCLWLHAVSVGEVNLLAPLLKMIEQERPEWECVISTTTATGMALAKKKYPKNTVFYCPLDFLGRSRRPCGASGPTCSCWPSWNCGQT